MDNSDKLSLFLYAHSSLTALDHCPLAKLITLVDRTAWEQRLVNSFIYKRYQLKIHPI